MSAVRTSAPISGTDEAEAVARDPDERDDGLGAHRVELRRGAALVAGLLSAFGLAGFVVTGVGDVTARSGETLLGFELNALQNLVHLALGVSGLVAARSSTGTRIWVLVLVGASLALLLYGMNVERDVLALNEADNWLHLGVLIVAGWLAAAAVSVAGPRGGLRGIGPTRPG